MRVKNIGSLEEMDSWEKAYPEIDFINEIHGFDEIGNDSIINIEWNERTITEKIFFVAIKKSSEMELLYEMVVEDEIKVSQKIDDPEKIWFMWLNGCFTGDDLEEEALWLFVENSLEGVNEILKFKNDLDFEKFEITSIDARIRPF